MKKFVAPLALICLLIIGACKKNKTTAEEPVNPTTPVNNDNYSSLADFYAKNGTATEVFSFSAGSGGSFVSAKGTTIHVPANAFAVSLGSIKLEFRDIYTKSDMLLSNMDTRYHTGIPLKSAGEFFIKATASDVAVNLQEAKKIEIVQPLANGEKQIDTAMKALNLAVDTVGAGGNAGVWVPGFNNLAWQTSNYIYSLYSFSSPIKNGSWCNSDNPGYFSGYTQTKLTMRANKSGYNPDVCLLFKGVNSMVHVYGSADFVYDYAPLGLQCTVVAFGVKDGKLHASFQPITIGSNQTVNFDLTETTTEKFKEDLKALN